MSNFKRQKESLFKEFPPVSTKEWEQVISKDLNGASYKQKLRWDTGETVNPLPFYRREDLAKIDRKGIICKKNASKNSWEIRSLVFGQDIEKASKSARKALAAGADTLQITLRFPYLKNKARQMEGIPIYDQKQFSRFFNPISLEETTLHFDSGPAAPALLAMLWNESQNQRLDANKIRVSFLYDPFASMLLYGRQPEKIEVLEKDLIRMANFGAENLPASRCLGIDARIYHNAGGTIVQQLGYALAAASEYLDILTDVDFAIADITKSLHFSFAIGSKYFLEIAKFRAARLLWENLINAYDGNTQKHDAYIHGETSRWNKTLYSPYTNTLRTTTAGMSAAIAGCDSITVNPFDQHFQKPDDFSQRIARNQQIIMREEAYFDKVKDPAAGSYYIEKLTDDIASKAWRLFKEVEREGGLFQIISKGDLQSAIKQSQIKREKAIAKTVSVFVGTNKFVNPDEKMAEEIDIGYNKCTLAKSEAIFAINRQRLLQSLGQAFSDGATLADVMPSLIGGANKNIPTITPCRGPREFEKIRLKNEMNTGMPKILILPLGDEKIREKRSQLVRNFFGSVGYELENPNGFKTMEEAIKTIGDSSPDIVAVCSSDEEYRKIVPTLCNKVHKLQDPPLLVLAGISEADIEGYKEAGIDAFIHEKCDILAILKRIQQKLTKR